MGCNCNNQDNFSIVEAAKSIGRVASSAVKTMTVQGYNPLTSKEEAERRMEICRGCEAHTLTFNKMRCTICGCFLAAKTSLKDQSCPHPDGPKW